MANNAKSQRNNDRISELRAAITATQQQPAMLVSSRVATSLWGWHHPADRGNNICPFTAFATSTTHICRAACICSTSLCCNYRITSTTSRICTGSGGRLWRGQPWEDGSQNSILISRPSTGQQSTTSGGRHRGGVRTPPNKYKVLNN